MTGCSSRAPTDPCAATVRSGLDLTYNFHRSSDGTYSTATGTHATSNHVSYATSDAGAFLHLRGGGGCCLLDVNPVTGGGTTTNQVGARVRCLKDAFVANPLL